LLFAAVAVSIDISERIDDFLENSAPLSGILLQYYLNFVPYIIFFLSPLFIFIAAIFFTSRLASRSEISRHLSRWGEFLPLAVCALLSSPPLF
jgi:lipopolysaccharide export system permease protein